MGRSLIYLVFCFIVVINLSQALPINEAQLIVPRQGDYHIGSRYDPFKEAINSGRGPNDDDGNKNDEGNLINPAIRVPSTPSLLPWEDDPEIVYVTEKQPETTNATTMVTSPSTPKSTPQSTTTSTTTSSPISTVSLLPWEEDSWQLFETTDQSNSTINLITGASTWRTPLIITPSLTTTTTKLPIDLITGQSTWKTPIIVTIPTTTTKRPLTSTSTTIRPSTTTTSAPTTTYSPLPWEEDYLDNTDDRPTQAQPTLQPFEPPTTTTIKSTTSTRSTTPIKISTQPVPFNSDDDEPIFNLVPLKPIWENLKDPNWSNFPTKFPTTSRIRVRLRSHHIPSQNY